MQVEDLDELLARARVAFDALTPDQQAHHRHEQRISFAAGTVALSWPEPRCPTKRLVSLPRSPS